MRKNINNYNKGETSILNRRISFHSMALLCLFTSVISFNVKGINIALGDFILLACDFLLARNLLNGVIIKEKVALYLKNSILIIVIFLFFCLFSVINVYIQASDIQRSVIELTKLIVAVNYGVLFIFYFATGTNENYEKFLKTLLYSGFLISIFAILGVVLYNLGYKTSLVMNGSRAKSFMSDTNIMAIFLMTVLPLVVNSKFKSVKKYIFISIYVIAIILAASKASVIVGLFLLCTYILGLLYIRMYKESIKILIGVILLISIFIVFFRHNQLLSLFFERIDSLKGANTSELTTGRSDLWKFALSIIFSSWNNFLLGIGYGNFSIYIQTINVPYYLYGIDLVHNSILSMFLETGVFNFILIIFCIVKMLKGILIILKRDKNILTLIMLISFLSLLIGLNEVNLQNNRFVYILISYYYYYCIKFSSIHKMKEGKGRL